MLSCSQYLKYLVEFQKCWTLCGCNKFWHITTLAVTAVGIEMFAELRDVVSYIIKRCCTTVNQVCWCLSHYLTIPGSHEWLNRARVGNNPPPRNTERAALSFRDDSSCSSDISWALNFSIWRWCSNNPPTNTSSCVNSYSGTSTLFQFQIQDIYNYYYQMFL